MNRDFTEQVEQIIVESASVRRLANGTQKLVSAPFQNPALRLVKTFLNGTWLEHPLHPVLTDIPVGAWTATMVLDLLSLIFGVRRLGRASSITTGLGIL